MRTANVESVIGIPMGSCRENTTEFYSECTYDAVQLTGKTVILTWFYASQLPQHSAGAYIEKLQRGQISEAQRVERLKADGFWVPAEPDHPEVAGELWVVGDGIYFKIVAPRSIDGRGPSALYSARELARQLLRNYAERRPRAG